MKIKKDILEQIYAQAESGLPNEVCGYLAGKDGEVLKHYELTNIDASPEHFTMDPKEQMTVVKDVRAQGFLMMACYHSHPETGARPSDEDIRLAYDSKISYVIISLKEGKQDIKSFKIVGTDVAKEALEIV